MGSRYPRIVADVRWVLRDASGTEMRATETFSTQEEAEAWMSSGWSELLAEGAESVSLLDGDEVLYEMGLKEE